MRDTTEWNEYRYQSTCYTPISFYFLITSNIVLLLQDSLQDEPTAGAELQLPQYHCATTELQLPQYHCTSREGCDAVSQPDRIAAKTSASVVSKHSSPGVSGKRLRKEKKMARKARRAEEQRQKAQRPQSTTTEMEHPGGSICI